MLQAKQVQIVPLESTHKMQLTCFSVSQNVSNQNTRPCSYEHIGLMQITCSSVKHASLCQVKRVSHINPRSAGPHLLGLLESAAVLCQLYAAVWMNTA